MERQVFLSSNPEEKLISFVNGLGFHVLDWIVLLETEFGIDSANFTSDAVKVLEKRFRQFPYIEDKTIFDMTFGESMDVLESVTGLQLKGKDERIMKKERDWITFFLHNNNFII